ncbi:hypothetical protein EW145_g2660 [Phellinidium pouzarii]|uniref:Uncharacterized protein n=1 Tax=Phellinidium pouzarii TaxID=167371 RepID=A0A4S4LBY2_9AGAM|nr:hypothetical protein EW145_g2660 [Phellinidium pouzarii]
MGGKAFAEELGTADVFPRIPARVYLPLKARLAAQLKTLYAYVDTPAKTPEKGDHGDIDFVVCNPLTASGTDSTDSALSKALSHVKDALGAQYCKIVDGPRMSNFAVPLDAELEGKFCQVDVHVCKDKAEWKRTLFFHSYGDMGMILGLLSRARGFTLGTKGLRTHYAKPNESQISSFPLSDSFDEILPFLGLSMETWARGFATRAEVLAWLKTSRFFVPRRLITAFPTQEKKAARNKREMYQEFLELSHALAAADVPESGLSVERAKEDTRQKALVYFKKKDAYDAIVTANVRERIFRDKFNGTKMMEWTGLHGKVIRVIMHGVRERLSEAEITDMDEKALRKLVLEIRPEAEIKYAATKDLQSEN